MTGENGDWVVGDRVWLAEANGERVREVEILALGEGGIPFVIGFNGHRWNADFDDLFETEADAIHEATKLLDERIRQHALDAANLVHVRGELRCRYEAIAMPF
jgi:hypothetical protein